MIYRKYVKRLFDIILSLFAIVLLSPLLVVLSLLVRIRLGSPVLFRQKRPGYKGKIFELMKFRTMTDKKDETGSTVSSMWF